MSEKRRMGRLGNVDKIADGNQPEASPSQQPDAARIAELRSKPTNIGVAMSVWLKDSLNARLREIRDAGGRFPQRTSALIRVACEFMLEQTEGMDYSELNSEAELLQRLRSGSQK